MRVTCISPDQRIASITLQNVGMHGFLDCCDIITIHSVILRVVSVIRSVVTFGSTSDVSSIEGRIETLHIFDNSAHDSLILF